MLAAVNTSKLTDWDLARLAFLRASNTLWALGRACAGKRDHRRRVAYRSTECQQLYRRVPHCVLVCDGPAAVGGKGVGKPRTGRAARGRRCRDSSACLLS